jgi:hypothetical protein
MGKENRNERILELHNEGKTVRQISDEVNLSIGGVHKVLSSVLDKADVMPKIPSRVLLTGNEERFTNFGGWLRTNVNEYTHKETGEVVYLTFVRSKEKGGYGYFVKIG